MQSDKIIDGLLNFTKKYEEKFNIEEILDIGDIHDDPYQLSIEIARQPAIFAYTANLKRVAENNWDKINDRFTQYKADNLKVVIEYLKIDGVAKPTTKLIEEKFIEIFGKKDLYIQLSKQLQDWRKRKEMLGIVLDTIKMRESSFKSMSYLFDSMIKGGLMHAKKSNRKEMV